MADGGWLSSWASVEPSRPGGQARIAPARLQLLQPRFGLLPLAQIAKIGEEALVARPHFSDSELHGKVGRPRSPTTTRPMPMIRPFSRLQIAFEMAVGFSR
jgi:hypothetical protein